ncbi:CHASE2 domain-containing protein [Sulfurimonas sp.]
MYKNDITKLFDYKVYDYFSKSRGYDRTPKESNVVVVDIDEKSLKALGQWPWPRILVANLIDKIYASHPSTIGLDIIFPEKDRTSPKEIASFYKQYFHLNNPIESIPLALRDNDKILSNILEKSASVMSLYLSKEKLLNRDCAKINSLNLTNTMYDLQSYDYILCNTPVVHTSAKYEGYVNTKIDEDGILRRMPLFLEYKDKIIPTLGLAILLNIDSKIKQLNKNTLEIFGHKVQTDKKSQVLLNFYKKYFYKKISAIDVLHGKHKELLLGKVVIIGSSATGLHDQVIITAGEKIVGVKVHMTLIDNILNDELRVQPQSYKYSNIFISLVLSFLLFFLLTTRHNLAIIVLFIGTFTTAIALTLVGFEHNTYISIGYLIGPFLLHFFLVGFLFIIIDAYERQLFTQELNRSHVALLDSMVHVAEVHDIETGAHIVRTKLYIKILAEYMYDKGIYKKYLSPKKIEMMYRTAPLHDLGKVGIEDSILKKKGKLTPMEFEVMKTHADLGRHIINNAISSYQENDFFAMARNIAHHHHEKWDGSGYPTGLKGEDIPIEARFMAIADVFDALVSRRVYKEPFSYEKTLKIIQEGREKHFDPVLVDAFFEIKEEFIKIAEIYSDENY